MYNIGDKVVPINKSIYGSLEESKYWNRAREKGQHYLIVNFIWGDGEISCHDGNNHIGGDLFIESDLIPYVEPLETKPAEHITIKLKAKDIVSLINAGIINENDEFYLSKA